jgi:hypothetical protein
MCKERVEAVSLRVVVLVCMLVSCLFGDSRRGTHAECLVCAALVVCSVVWLARCWYFTFVPALVYQFNHHINLVHGGTVEVFSHIRC